MLARNIRLNDFHDRVKAVHAAAGRSEGTTQFSIGLGTENYVTTGTAATSSVSVRMTTLDKELAGNPPDLLKVDVEGFETEVFAGAANTLRDPKLKAIIVERNNLGARYGFMKSRCTAKSGNAVLSVATMNRSSGGCSRWAMVRVKILFMYGIWLPPTSG
jgi:FkbM family methyltransferase